MKSITEYISNYAENKYLNEGLIQWFKEFFKKVFTSQKSRLTPEGKVNMYTVNDKNIKYQKEPILLSKVERETLDEWSNPKLGYPIITQIIKNKSRTLVDINGNKIDPEIYTFFTQDEDGKRTYSIGLLAIDKNSTYVEGYRHIIDIEANLIVDNTKEVMESILEQYKQICNDEDPNIIGLSAKANNIHPKLKGNLNNLSFKINKDNKEILIYKF